MSTCRTFRVIRACRALVVFFAAWNAANLLLHYTVWRPSMFVTWAAGAGFLGACVAAVSFTRVLHFLGWRRVLGWADLLAVMWILLAGPAERKRLRRAVARRRDARSLRPVDVLEREAGLLVPGDGHGGYRSGGPVRQYPVASRADIARARLALQQESPPAGCLRCGYSHVLACGLCGPCYHRLQKGR